jgi:isocitrate dehydrogenase
MNGDIISDLSSALIGGLGFAPSANIGNEVAIFEAVHGSAPKYAGKNVINPLAVLFSGVMMLRHLGMFEEAASIEHAVLFTLEEGKVLPRDIVGDEKAASTTNFTKEIINNLGKPSKGWQVRNYKPVKLPKISADVDFVKATSRQSVGVDVFVESPMNSEDLGHSLEKISQDSTLKLKMVSNRGTKVYPKTGAITDCVDQWFCRFVAKTENSDVSDAEIIDLLQKVGSQHRWMHIEKLQQFNGDLAFTKAQGED